MKEILDYTLIARYDIRVIDLLAAVGVLLGAWLFWKIIETALLRAYRRRKIDEGAQYAANQIISYAIMVFAVLSALQSLHFQLTAIWAGAAALLVGLGLGLQQTFNDFTSGLILLFEQSIRVGDWVELSEKKGRILRIGPRASEIVTFDNELILVPNSKLVTEIATNWSKSSGYRIFTCNMLLNHGTDIRRAIDLALESMRQHPHILAEPEASAEVNEIRERDVVLELAFATKNFAESDTIMADLRLSVTEKWAEAGLAYRPISVFLNDNPPLNHH